MANVSYYGPPLTDSEDEYDGFTFGDDHIKKRERIRWTADCNEENQLYNALIAGDLELFKQQVRLQRQFNADENINGAFTPLLHACKLGHIDIATYLLDELRASPNKHYDSYTPLMYACDTNPSPLKEPRVAEKLVHLLLKHNADVNIADKYGVTPFMLACKNGYTAVVRLLLDKVSFDNVDNMGQTPIFYAVEKNHADIVKILVEAGADLTIPNGKGYTPKQVAQFHGFYDLLEILPQQQETYTVPASFLGYCTLRDSIPRLFLKSECPEYFQEIYNILIALNLEKLLEYFALKRISLGDFLCMTDEHLKEIGIKYPIYRMKLQKGLLDFHLHNWNTMCIDKLNKSTKETFEDVLLLAGNHLKNLVIIKSCLRYVRNNLSKNKLGKVDAEELKYVHAMLQAYQSSVVDLRNTAKYLSSFCPQQNPLYIDYEAHTKERTRNKLKRFFKYTTIIVGVSIFICLKIPIF